MCDAGEVDLNQVRRVKAEAEGELLKLAGVTGVGVGYKVVGGRTTGALAILVYVKHKRNVPEVEAIPHEIRGIPTDVIERRFVLHSGKASEAEEPPTQVEQPKKGVQE